MTEFSTNSGLTKTVYTTWREPYLFFFTFRSEKSIQKGKRDLKKEKNRWPNDAWKSYLKTWGVEPQLQRSRVVMAYSHKTQPFMKNGGQQKCLDKPRTYAFYLSKLFSFSRHSNIVIFSLPFHIFQILKDKWKWNNLWCHELACIN